jgi:hypothetical protein
MNNVASPRGWPKKPRLDSDDPAVVVVGSFIDGCPEFLWALLRRDGPSLNHWPGGQQGAAGIFGRERAGVALFTGADGA